MVKDLCLYFAVFIICGVVFLPLHVLAVRARHGEKLLTTVNSVIGISALIGAASGWLWLGGLFSSEGAKAVACVAGGVSFLGFAGIYNLLGPASVDRSISAHILKLLHNAPQHRMTEADLFKFYTHADVLEKRFNECADTGFIERHGAELVLTRKGARVARFYVILGGILGMRSWYLDRYRADAKPDAG